MILSTITYNGELSGAAYLILTAMFLIIVGGLSWCFYRALTAGNDKTAGEQLPDEV